VKLFGLRLKNFTLDRLRHPSMPPFAGG